MMKYFNTEGFCKPKEHYMVRLDDRLAQIKSMLVDRNKYFVINRGTAVWKNNNFNKNKEVGVKEIQVGGKLIVEAVV